MSLRVHLKGGRYVLLLELDNSLLIHWVIPLRVLWQLLCDSLLLIPAMHLRDLTTLWVASAAVWLHRNGYMWIPLREIAPAVMTHLIDGLVVLGRLLMVAGRTMRHGIVSSRICSLLMWLHH